MNSFKYKNKYLKVLGVFEKHWSYVQKSILLLKRIELWYFSI